MRGTKRIYVGGERGVLGILSVRSEFLNRWIDNRWTASIGGRKRRVATSCCVQCEGVNEHIKEIFFPRKNHGIFRKIRDKCLPL